MPTPFAPYLQINQGPVGLVLFIRMQTNLNSVTVTAEPTNAPQFGDIYFLGAGPNTGFQWAGFRNVLAFYSDDANWRFVTPDPSRIYTAQDTGIQYVWNGTTFVVYAIQNTIRVVTGNTTVLNTDKIIEANAASGVITVTVPLSLGNAVQSQSFRIVKTDTTANFVTISDGTNTVDQIVTGASANGQIGGWREVYSNGTHLRSMGIG